MIIVDTNVIAYAARSGENSKTALIAKQIDPDWVAPRFWRFEMEDILVKSMRFEAMSLTAAMQVFAVAELLVKDSDVLLDDSSVRERLSLSTEKETSAYDGIFVHLAGLLDVPLVTADRRLVARCPKIAILLKEFAESGV